MVRFKEVRGKPFAGRGVDNLTGVVGAWELSVILLILLFADVSVWMNYGSVWLIASRQLSAYTSYPD